MDMWCKNPLQTEFQTQPKIKYGQTTYVRASTRQDNSCGILRMLKFDILAELFN